MNDSSNRRLPKLGVIALALPVGFALMKFFELPSLRLAGLILGASGSLYVLAACLNFAVQHRSSTAALLALMLALMLAPAPACLLYVYLR